MYSVCGWTFTNGGGDKCFQISGLLGSHECKCLYLDHLVSVNTDNGEVNVGTVLELCTRVMVIYGMAYND